MVRKGDSRIEGRGSLTAWPIVGLIRAAGFGLLLWSVLVRGGLTSADSSVATYIASHRPGWLTPVIQLVTWLGSSFFIVPFGLTVGGFLWRRRPTLGPHAMLGVAVL